MEQDGDPQTAGMRVEARIATFLVLATVVYFPASSENAGLGPAAGSLR